MRPTSTTVPSSGALKLLQRGNGSKIYVMIRGSERPKYAIKMVTNTSMYSKQVKCLENEHRLLSKITHQHVIRVSQDLKKNYNFEGAEHTALMMEFARRSTLLEVRKFFGEIDMRVVRKLFKQVATGMKYLHNQKKIAHLDLQLENIFVAEPYTCQIGDFGLSKDEDVEALIESVGTYNVYMPPEIHRIELDKQDGKKPKEYNGFKADVFSFGATLFAFIFNTPCFYFAVPEKDETYQKISCGDWEHVWEKPNVKALMDTYELQDSSLLDDLKQLFKLLLKPDPSQRPSFQQILEHPWFQGATLDSNLYFNSKTVEILQQNSN